MKCGGGSRFCSNILYYNQRYEQQIKQSFLHSYFGNYYFLKFSSLAIISTNIVSKSNYRDLDNFADSPNQTFKKYPAEVSQKRWLLTSLKEKNGLKAFEREWWHHCLSDGNRFEMLDIEFNNLKNEL